MKIKIPAKVNLALDVLNRLENGYHELDMIMAPVNVFDEMEIQAISPSKNPVQDEIKCSNEQLPENNTLSKAMELLRETYPIRHFYKISLHKGIPSQAGMGGGSADAAALIKAISRLEGLNLSMDQMQKIGAKVGADVPYCLLSGYARVKGFGEKTEPIFTDWQIPVLLIQPDEGISTPECFRVFDELEKPVHYDIDIIEDALIKKDPALLYSTMTNALEEPAFEQLPILQEIKEEMNDEGIVRVMMTGSGSVMMGFSVDEEVLEQAEKKLKDRYPFVKRAIIGLMEE